MKGQITRAQPAPLHTGQWGELKKTASLCGVSPVPLHRGQILAGLATCILPLPLHAVQNTNRAAPLPLHIAQSTVSLGTTIASPSRGNLEAYSGDLIGSGG